MTPADSATAALPAGCVPRGRAFWIPLLLGLGLAGRSEVVLAPPFQDHAVLQCGKSVPVWGKAGAGEAVTVEFAGQRQSATADATGRWRVTFDPLAASAEPRDLVVLSANQAAKTETRKISDVLVGEVWLCSGQSNMDFRLARAADGPEDIAAADFPAIRQLRIARNPAAAPQETVAAAWAVCSPATAADFTAVGFYFARDLWRARGVPIGIIACAHGDTPVETWLSAETLGGAPEFGVVAQRWADEIATAPAVKRYQAPAGLFNGMVHPLLPYALRGFLWYQGESNARRASEYARLFPALVRQWRRDFQQGDLPFLWVQLPNLGQPALPPGTTGTDWVALRVAQTAALALPATGQAVTIDVGDPANIHPPRKREVGERLARLARRQMQGEAITDRGPEPVSFRAENDTVRVWFALHGSRLVLRGDAADAFELAGADGGFAPATAVAISREDLVVHASGIPHPVAVRYAWRADPVAVLFNGDGLPAGPFFLRPTP